MKYKSLAKLGFYDKKKVKNKVLSFLNKTLICGLILIISLIVLKKNPDIKEYVNNKVFNNNFSFAYIKNWYNEHFGNILPTIDNKVEEVFSEKLAYKNKQPYLDGYILEVSNNYLVPSINTGIVVFIGEKEGYGNVLIIEQVDGYNIWYGNLDNISVKLYEYVAKGTFLGETVDNSLYIVCQNKGEFIDFEKTLS